MLSWRTWTDTALLSDSKRFNVSFGAKTTSTASSISSIADTTRFSSFFARVVLKSIPIKEYDALRTVWLSGPGHHPWPLHQAESSRKSPRREFAEVLMGQLRLWTDFSRWNGLMARGHLVFAESNEGLCRLLEAVAAGDAKAFRTLYGKSVPVLFGICVRLMRDRTWRRTCSRKR